MPAAKATYLSGRSFFPHLISLPFRDGLHEAFDFAAAACFVAALASWLRGKKYYHGQVRAASPVAEVVGARGAVATIAEPGPGAAEPVHASAQGAAH